LQIRERTIERLGERFLVIQLEQALAEVLTPLVQARRHALEHRVAGIVVFELLELILDERKRVPTEALGVEREQQLALGSNQQESFGRLEQTRTGAARQLDVRLGVEALRRVFEDVRGLIDRHVLQATSR